MHAHKQKNKKQLSCDHNNIIAHGHKIHNPVSPGITNITNNTFYLANDWHSFSLCKKKKKSCSKNKVWTKLAMHKYRFRTDADLGIDT